MTPAAKAKFEAQRLKTQYALYAKPIKIAGVLGRGCYDAARFSMSGTQGGQMLGFDSILKVLQSEWPAYTAQKHWDQKTVALQLNGEFVAFKIADVINIHQAGEWKLTLEALI